MTARIWIFLTATAWTLTWIADHWLKLTSPALADHLWYGCAILSLCPPMAVLGARRPGTRVWTWFILFPMLLALSWPIGALWFQGSELRGLSLETPQLIAACLVLVMGIGNYCGTTYTVSALLYGGAILVLVVSSSARCPVWLSSRETVRLWCTVAVTLAIILIRTSRRPPAETRFDRLWIDFFDTFGIVWGRRIQDRVNFIAAGERLPVRLELHGFVWLPERSEKTDSLARSPAGGGSTDDRQNLPSTSVTALADRTSFEVEPRIDHILRWLLRRFVDPPWIDERLGSNSRSDVRDVTVDS